MFKMIIFYLAILTPLLAQSEKVEAGEQSDLARLLKSSGSLLVKEEHSLPKLKTTFGNDIECSVFILRNLSTDSEGEIGLKLSRKEEYSTRSALLDFAELDGLSSSVKILQEKGIELCTVPSITPPPNSKNSTEVDYISKDGLKFGVYVKKGKLNYAIQVSRTADWAFLKESSVTQLQTNIKTILNLKSSE